MSGANLADSESSSSSGIIETAESRNNEKDEVLVLDSQVENPTRVKEDQQTVEISRSRVEETRSIVGLHYKLTENVESLAEESEPKAKKFRTEGCETDAESSRQSFTQEDSGLIEQDISIQASIMVHRNETDHNCVKAINSQENDTFHVEVDSKTSSEYVVKNQVDVDIEGKSPTVENSPIKVIEDKDTLSVDQSDNGEVPIDNPVVDLEYKSNDDSIRIIGEDAVESQSDCRIIGVDVKESQSGSDDVRIIEVDLEESQSDDDAQIIEVDVRETRSVIDSVGDDVRIVAVDTVESQSVGDDIRIIGVDAVENQSDNHAPFIGPVMETRHYRNDEDISETNNFSEIQRNEKESDEPKEARSPIDWSSRPHLVAIAKEEYSRSKNNYLRGCKWSPDGSCLLANSRDNTLRLFNHPATLCEKDNDPIEMIPVLRMQEPDLIYDFCWYPLMSSHDPASSCFVSTSRRHAIHLRDAYSGNIRCLYKPINHVDELEAAISLAFSYDGAKIYAGFSGGVIRVFDLNRPGGTSERRPCLGKRKVQGGIISCIATAPKSHLYAAGSYNRSVALFAEPGSLVAKLRGQGGGVTQLNFTPDGRYLISGGRKDPEILVWDLRRPGKILFTMEREVGTNQRMFFDLNESGQQLLTGNHSGEVSAFDFTVRCASELSPVSKWTAHADTCNGISLNERTGVLATSSGQWTVPVPRLMLDGSDSSDEETEFTPRKEENCLKLWQYT